jgi:hypothetical protein
MKSSNVPYSLPLIKNVTLSVKSDKFSSIWSYKSLV